MRAAFGLLISASGPISGKSINPDGKTFGVSLLVSMVFTNVFGSCCKYCGLTCDCCCKNCG